MTSWKLGKTGSVIVCCLTVPSNYLNQCWLHKWVPSPFTCWQFLRKCTRWSLQYIDGLVQGRRNSIANTLELRLSCTNPLTSEHLELQFTFVLARNRLHVVYPKDQYLVRYYFWFTLMTCTMYVVTLCPYYLLMILIFSTKVIRWKIW